MEMRSESMAKLLKFLIIAVAIGYVVCPDLLPGPVDDLIMMLLGAVVQNKINVTDSFVESKRVD